MDMRKFNITSNWSISQILQIKRLLKKEAIRVDAKGHPTQKSMMAKRSFESLEYTEIDRPALDYVEINSEFTHQDINFIRNTLVRESINHKNSPQEQKQFLKTFS